MPPFGHGISSPLAENMPQSPSFEDHLAAQIGLPAGHVLGACPSIDHNQALPLLVDIACRRREGVSISRPQAPSKTGIYSSI